MTQDSAVGTTSAAASFSCDGGGDGDDEALERSTQRRRRRVGRGEMKASVWRVRLEIVAPPPPDSGESCGRGAAATAAIAEREGKYEVIVFLVILTGSSFSTVTVCHKNKKNTIFVHGVYVREREACVCRI